MDAKKKTGVLTALDTEGNAVEMYPDVEVDATLTQTGKPADAASVGAAISELSSFVGDKLNLKANKTDVDTQISNLKQEILGDTPVDAYDTFTELAAYIKEHESVANALTDAIGTKANKSDVDNELSLKASKTDVDSAISTLNATIDAKANASDVNTALSSLENDISAQLETKANKTDVDSAISALSTTVDTKANKTDVDSAISTLSVTVETKANTSDVNSALSTLETDIYNQLETKANTSYVDSAISNIQPGDNSVILSQAEYDALSDEEKDSDTTYYINDGDAQPNAFSIPFTSDKYAATTAGGALVEAHDKINSLSNIKISPVVDSNGNPFQPNAFMDSTLSIGYTHGTILGLDVTAYIPILTTRWYESSENIRTIQYALSGISIYIRYSTSAMQWSTWEKLVTNSELEEISTIKGTEYTTIVDMGKNVENSGIRTFSIGNYANITDYPSKLIDIGAIYYPIVEIKKYSALSHVTVRAMHAGGTPYAINGYITGSKLYWGTSVY